MEMTHDNSEVYLEYAKSGGYEVMHVLKDVANCLNEDRKSLKRLFDIVEEWL